MWSYSPLLVDMETMGNTVFGIKQTKIAHLEKTYNDHLLQPPEHFRVDQKLKCVVKGIA